MALIMTAVQQGATVANHVEVVELIKDENGMTKGAKMRDCITGETWNTAAKVRSFIDPVDLSSTRINRRVRFVS